LRAKILISFSRSSISYSLTKKFSKSSAGEKFLVESEKFFETGPPEVFHIFPLLTLFNFPDLLEPTKELN